MQNLYCIACPAGCELELIGTGKLMVVNGNKCSKGKDFAISESQNPTRVLTTTVRTNFPDIPVISVRTDGEIPKGMLMRAMHELKDIVVKDELACGDVIVENLLGSGVPVIITSGALKQVGAELENKNVQLGGDISVGSPDNVVTAMPSATATGEEDEVLEEDFDEEDEDWRSRSHIRR
ncbi:MAG: DUF1667 domain-containing protein [Oscillospiraceae bacterium]|nr:DUF1667 domain-containing protein [Oscillospiraceae bacterium]MCL2279056.1 DUF1667 domain-containing protein [Oscillospiraceae bacterium]